MLNVTVKPKERYMIDLKTYENLSSVVIDDFQPKPTTLTEGQKEAALQLWTSADGATKIGVWECTLGEFTAGRSTVAEYCQIISGSASVRNYDGNGARYSSPGDLLVPPLGWKGNWIIHQHIGKPYVLEASS
jgi:uncharacterized cupin superfamily protein